MSLARKITDDQWDVKDDARGEIEDIAAYNPELAEKMSMLALRFISEKGLSREFADLLREVSEFDNTPDTPTP